MTVDNTPRLALRGISKSFGAVRAIRSADEPERPLLLRKPGGGLGECVRQLVLFQAMALGAFHSP